MKARIFSLILLIAVPAVSWSQAGILRRAINRQISNEIDSALDKKVQDEQNKNRAKQKEAAAAQQKQADETATQQQAQDQPDQSGGGFGTRLFGNKVDLKYKEEYNFSSRIYMKMETYDKKDVTKMDFYMFYSINSPSIGVETNSITTEDADAVPVTAKMVVDGENKIFLMLTEVNSMKIGMISAIPDENAQVMGPDGKPAKKTSTPVFTKTGNTRVVAGYKCDEYTYVYPEEKMNGKVWFSKEPGVLVDKRAWSNSGMAAYYGYNEFRDGLVLASEGYDDKGKLISKAETIEIAKNYPHSIAVKGYTLRQMNLDQGSKK